MSFMYKGIGKFNLTFQITVFRNFEIGPRMFWIFSQRSAIIVDVDLFSITILLYPLAWNPPPTYPNGEGVKHLMNHRLYNVHHTL